MCYAECEGYTIDQVVECDDTNPFPSDCDCDFTFEPVCVEVDGETIPFPNACYAECEGYTADDFVDCGIFDPCGCDLDFDPVCVEVDGELLPFPNACWAACEGFTADDFVDCDGNSPSNLVQLETDEVEMFGKVDALGILQNPVQNVLTMNFDLVQTETAVMNISILSIGGELQTTRVERAIAGQNQVEINVTDLKSGVYFLRVQTKSGIQTIKFVK